MVETLDDVIEDLANRAGVYGCHNEDEKERCRICWTMGLKARILAAVEVDRKLAA